MNLVSLRYQFYLKFLIVFISLKTHTIIDSFIYLELFKKLNVFLYQSIVLINPLSREIRGFHWISFLICHNLRFLISVLDLFSII